ncbi:MAG TPA: aspartate-semialdehyde dehydrogenase [Myxococcota bacterium]|nr:aspartate-semialdehyde dehydrogenase [Myxococcota bacterium]
MTEPQRSPRSVAVVGATGAVGETLLEVLAERRFPISQLRVLASDRSAGATVRFRGEALTVEPVRPQLFDGVDLVFFAATGSLSKELAPEAQRRGAVVIDKSSTWRMDAAVPLVVPEVNPDAAMKHRGILACPNCTTIGFVMALEPLRRAAGLRSVVVTTLQAASGAGRDGTDELSRQMDALANGRELEAKVFPRPLAGNVLPLCESFREDGYSTEEMKLLLETRKIFGLPDLAVSMTCVRVPVAVGHSAALLVETEHPLTPAAARAALAAFPGLRVVDDPSNNVFPTPRDVAGRDEVLVGRIRRDLGSDRLWLWEVSDNLRKGAATNAVQTAELLLARGLV